MCPEWESLSRDPLENKSTIVPRKGLKRSPQLGCAQCLRILCRQHCERGRSVLDDDAFAALTMKEVVFDDQSTFVF